MDDKVRCQSCGMPISAEFQNLGTEIDGTSSDQYCGYCYQRGAFTSPGQTVDEMVASSIDFMTKNMGFDRDQATRMSNDVIRGLKRWN